MPPCQNTLIPDVLIQASWFQLNIWTKPLTLPVNLWKAQSGCWTTWMDCHSACVKIYVLRSLLMNTKILLHPPKVLALHMGYLTNEINAQYLPQWKMRQLPDISSSVKYMCKLMGVNFIVSVLTSSLSKHAVVIQHRIQFLF